VKIGAVTRLKAVAAGATVVGTVIVPGAAAPHPKDTLGWPFGIARGSVGVIGFVIPVNSITRIIINLFRKGIIQSSWRV